VTIDWAWRTEAVGPPAATPTPTPTPTPDPGGRPTPHVPPTTVEPEPPPVRGAPRLELRIPRQRVLGTRGIDVFGRCDRPCRVKFRARIQTSPLARGSARTLQRRRVFRALGAPRWLPMKGADRRIRLRLTPRAVRTLKRTMRLRGRVAIVVEGTARGARGSRTVSRRIVLKRAARTVTGGRAAPARG
jgi:hypothetical protein